MYRMKRIVAIVLLLLVFSAGTPQVFAEGPTETPGQTAIFTGPTETPGQAGTTQTSDADGPTETPGIFESMIIYVVTTLIA